MFQANGIINPSPDVQYCQLMGRNQELGLRGERVAVARLIARGHNILATNYRCPLGELDIVSVDNGTLVISEVKTRSRASLRFGLPGEAVGFSKMRKISRMTSVFLSDNQSEFIQRAATIGIRFDVIEIIVHNDRILTVNYVEDAFRL